VDSRNENLPEKCIHQNYASRPGGSRCRFFVACMRAPAMRFRLGIERDDMEVKGRPGGFRPRRTGPLIPAIFGCRNGSPPLRPLFPGWYLQGAIQLFRVPPPPWIECASGDGIAAYGASSYGARRTWRQAAGRSAILSPGLGFAGGPGLGWSTASVNQ